MSSKYWVSSVAAVFVLIVPTLCQAQKVYKWVDEKGNTHYSQQNPADKKAKPLDIVNNPQSNQNDDKPDATMENIKRMAKELEERDKRAREASDRETQSRDNRIAVEKENKRRQKEEDDKLIAECKRNRNVNCTSAERIREDDKFRMEEEMRRRCGPYGCFGSGF